MVGDIGRIAGQNKADDLVDGSVAPLPERRIYDFQPFPVRHAACARFPLSLPLYYWLTNATKNLNPIVSYFDRKGSPGEKTKAICCQLSCAGRSSDHIRKVLDVDQALLLPPAGVFHELTGIAGSVPGKSDQIAAVIHHIAVCADDGILFRHIFHARGIKSAVISFWNRDGTVKWMVGQQQSQRHLRVALFCCLYDLGGHAVEGTVMPYHKIGYATPRSAAPLPAQGLADTLVGLAVPDEKTGSFVFHVAPSK